MNRGRSILLAALYTPPSHSSGARRPAGLAKYLARLGYRVTVVTSVVAGQGPIAGAQHVVRTRDLLRTNLNWRRKNVEALASHGAAVAVAPPSFVERWLVPDVQLVSWMPFALPRALSLARDEPFDCVITTSPSHSVHLVGAALRRRGVPWIAELRDGWRFETSAQSPFANAALERLDAQAERALLSRADARVGITRTLADDLGERFAGPALHLPNAYDPEEMEAAEAQAAAGPDDLLSPARFSLVYTGSIVAMGVAPFALLDAMRALVDRRPDARRLELVIAGPVRSDVPARAQELGIGDLMRLVGSIPRTRALALQRAADALLVLVPHTRPSVVTNKLVEYLVAKRPLLVLGAGSEAGTLAAERAQAFVVGPGDVEAISAALERLLDGEAPPPARSGDHSDLAYPAVAARMAALIEDVAGG